VVPIIHVDERFESYDNGDNRGRITRLVKYLNGGLKCSIDRTFTFPFRLNREIFTTLTEAKVLIAHWRKEYNQFRQHSSLRYKPPAPEAKMLATLTLQVVPFPGADH
jgi:transposase InsO family protein